MEDKLVEISIREIEILRLVATGASNKEIAFRLNISTNTVKVHLRNIFRKIGAVSRTEAAMYAVNAGITAGVTPNGEGVLEQSNISQTRNSNNLPLNNTNFHTLLSNGIHFNRRLFGILGILFIGALSLAAFLFWQWRYAIDDSKQLELPNPQWQSLKPMKTARYGLAVALFENSIYAISGKINDKDVTGNVEKYDLTSGVWTSISNKPTPVYDANAIVIGGDIYVPGGRLQSDQVTNILEIYDPEQTSWRQGTSLPIAISAYASLAYEGQLYLFGGWDGDRFVNEVWSYNPNTDQWINHPTMQTARGYSGAAQIGTKIYILGGTNGKQALNVNEVFTPGSEIPYWKEAIPLPEERYGAGIGTITDIIYIIGGKNEKEGSLLPLAFFSIQGVWTTLEVPNVYPITFPGSVTNGSYIYIIGGKNHEKPVAENQAFQAVYTITLPFVR